MLLLASALEGQAQTFSATTTTVHSYPGYYYYYSLPDMTDTSTGLPVFGGNGQILCIQRGRKGPAMETSALIVSWMHPTSSITRARRIAP